VLRRDREHRDPLPRDADLFVRVWYLASIGEQPRVTDRSNALAAVIDGGARKARRRVLRETDPWVPEEAPAAMAP